MIDRPTAGMYPEKIVFPLKTSCSLLQQRPLACLFQVPTLNELQLVCCHAYFNLGGRVYYCLLTPKRPCNLFRFVVKDFCWQRYSAKHEIKSSFITFVASRICNHAFMSFSFLSFFYLMKRIVLADRFNFPSLSNGTKSCCCGRIVRGRTREYSPSRVGSPHIIRWNGYSGNAHVSLSKIFGSRSRNTDNKGRTFPSSPEIQNKDCVRGLCAGHSELYYVIRYKYCKSVLIVRELNRKLVLRFIAACRRIDYCT